jgi:hypothetical protein
VHRRSEPGYAPLFHFAVSTELYSYTNCYRRHVTASGRSPSSKAPLRHQKQTLHPTGRYVTEAEPFSEYSCVLPSRYSDWFTDWTTEESGFNSRKGKRFPVHNSSVLGLTYPPIRWILGTSCPGIKWPERQANHSPPSSAQVKAASTSLIYAFLSGGGCT